MHRTALQAAVLTADHCSTNGELGSTAYDALVLGSADSQGLAMAYRAVCDALDDIWGRYWWNVDRYPACDTQGFSWHPGDVLTISD